MTDEPQLAFDCEQVTIVVAEVNWKAKANRGK